MYIQAPHQASDRIKLASMIKALRDGYTLPKILVDEEGQAYSGSHRIEAYDRIREFEKFEDLEVEYHIISMEERASILESMNLESDHEVYDFEPFLEEAVFLGLAAGCK